MIGAIDPARDRKSRENSRNERKDGEHREPRRRNPRAPDCHAVGPRPGLDDHFRAAVEFRAQKQVPDAQIRRQHVPAGVAWDDHPKLELRRAPTGRSRTP
jgi:hypothetical protein